MKKTNILIGALACSLILNGFLAGYLTSSHEPRFRMHDPLTRMEMASGHIDPQYREKITTLIQDRRAELDKEMREMGHSFEEINPILTAPNFDAAKLKDLHTKLYKRDDHIKEGMLALLTDIAQALPDEERIKFFNEMDPGPPEFRGGPPGGPHGGPPPE